MKWGEMSGVYLALGRNGYRYKIQPTHGRGWLATEQDGKMFNLLDAKVFPFGPTSFDDAEAWCENQAKAKAAALPPAPQEAKS